MAGNPGVEGDNGTEGSAFSAAGKYQDLEKSTPETISQSDITLVAPEEDGTVLVLQRHGRYERDKDSDRAGSLTPEAAEKARALSQQKLEAMLTDLSDEERKTVDVFVLASNTQYFEKGRRSMETAEEVLASTKAVFEKFGLSEDQIINTQRRHRGEGGPRSVAAIREPQMFTKSEEFVDYLIEKYGGLGPEFWKAYETGAEDEKRIEMGAEGVEDMADRMDKFVRVMARYSKAYHEANPGRRLVIWADSHYDVISPYARKYVADMPMDEYLAVDYGGGIAINISPDGDGSTSIADREYKVRLVGPTKPDQTNS